MRTEEEFGVSIADSEAANVRTPGMLIELVLSKLSSELNPQCNSQKAFYILRTAVVALSGADRSRIHPDSELRPLFPGNDHRSVWGELQDQIEARSWPSLERSYFLSGSIIAATLSFYIFCAWLFSISGFGGLQFGLLIALLFMCFFAAACLRFTDSLKKLIPSKIKNFRDLVPYAQTSNQLQWSSAEVRGRVRDIVTGVLALKEDQYREQADFVKDLGLC
ncbi:MAG TPA: hypothetical protein VGR78_02105 [Verrucomicrobiae bacterium]|nr:hypothetical protein [Verrucomicrobiae bacterium]